MILCAAGRLVEGGPEVTSVERRIADLINADATLRGLFATRQPRIRFWEVGQTKFVYTTERMPDGKFHSCVYQPHGTGARDERGGWRAERWDPVRIAKHSTRKAAKAQALALYQKAEAR